MKDLKMSVDVLFHCLFKYTNFHALIVTKIQSPLSVNNISQVQVSLQSIFPWLLLNITCMFSYTDKNKCILFHETIDTTPDTNETCKS